MDLKRCYKLTTLHEFEGLFKVDPIPAGSLRFRVLSLLGLLKLLRLFYTYLWNVFLAIIDCIREVPLGALHVRDESQTIRALLHILNLASHFESRDDNPFKNLHLYRHHLINLPQIL